MTTKYRLQQLANQIKSAGLDGQSMQKKLSEIVSANDLTPHEIQRIAEMANRDVQLALYKTSSDKRFKFELANPEPLKAAAREESAKTGSGVPAVKTAALLAEVPADPFSVPYRPSEDLSLYKEPLEEKLAFEIESAEIRKTIQELDKHRLEFEALKKQGETEIIKVSAKASKDHDVAVQSALDLIMTGVSLPSLYQAIMAAVSGHRAPEDVRETARSLVMLIIQGLKKRGVANHRMGFRHNGDVPALDRLKGEELMERCEKSFPGLNSSDLDMEEAKRANYTQYVVANGDKPDLQDMVSEAEKHLSARPSQAKYPVPAQYLDPKNVDNLPGGSPRVINTDNEFVIAISDLVGDQSRMTRLHSAQEYVGLKLKQIESTMRDLISAKKTAEAAFEKSGNAMPPMAIGNQPGRFQSMLSGAKNLGSTLYSQAKANPLTALGVGAGVAGLAPMVMRSKDSVAAEEMQNKYLKNQREQQQGQTRLASVELEVNGVKQAFLSAAVGAVAKPIAAAAGKAMASTAGQTIKSVGSKAIGALGSPAMSNAVGIASMLPREQPQQ